jgi:hypothetical protein
VCSEYGKIGHFTYQVFRSNGMHCIVGCSPVIRETPPTFGSILSVKHSGYFKNGTLKNPFLWRTTNKLVMNTVENVHWIEHSNSREFFDKFGKKMDYKMLDDFYNITAKGVKISGGGALLENLYNNSLIEALKDVYPWNKWLAWRFLDSVKPGFWDSKDNQKDFLDYLGKQLGFKLMEDWYTITQRHICEHGGSGILRIYGNSPSKIITAVYSNHKWISRKFNTVLRGHWDYMDNRKDFLNNLGKQLGFKQIEDWYSITCQQINENGGAGLLSKCGGSPSKMVMSAYSDHKWISTRFSHVLRGYWEIEDNQRNYLDTLGQKLGFKKMEDWYNISKNPIIQNGGSWILSKYGNSPYKFVMVVYSTHNWKQANFKVDRSSSKSFLK